MTENEFSGLVDEVTDAAKATQEVQKIVGGPLTLLLGPMLKVYGDHLGELTKQRLSIKQTENLDKIANQSGYKQNSPKPSVMQVAALIDWTQSAKDVDSTVSPKLAKAWAHALDRIFMENFQVSQALKGLNENLVDTFLNKRSISRQECEALISCGLVKRKELLNNVQLLVTGSVKIPITFTILTVLLISIYNFVQYLLDGFSFKLPDLMEAFISLVVSWGLSYLLVKIHFDNEEKPRNLNRTNLEITDLGEKLYAAITGEQPKTVQFSLKT